MASIANVTVADGETTPVDHTFTPRGVLPVVRGLQSLWRNESSGNPAAYEKLTMWVTQTASPLSDIMTPGKAVSPNKVRIKLELPSTYVDASGLTLLDFSDVWIVEYLGHPRSTTQHRKNGRTLMRNILTSTAGINAIDYSDPAF